MSTYLRTINVTTQQHIDSGGVLSTSLAWVDATVPMGFDFGAGDRLSVAATFEVASEDTLPDTLHVFVDIIPVQMNGGVMNAGPYQPSGNSYAIGSGFVYYGDLNDSWTTPGTHAFAPTGGPLAQSQNAPPIIDATASGFPGESGVLFTVSPMIPPDEVAGWNLLNAAAQGGPNTAFNLAAGDNFTFEVYIQAIPQDALHPNRSLFLAIKSMALVWIPNIGPEVNIPLDLSSTKVGFNTGGVDVPGQLGLYTYNASRTVELTPPATSSLQQDMYLVSQVSGAPRAKLSLNYARHHA